MDIIGISCFYHDSAACFVRDGKIIAAAQEERFTRKKHDPRFPKNAVDYCLEQAGIRIQNLDYLVYYDTPLLTFERLLMSYLTVAPKGLKSWLQAMPLWLGKKLYIPKVIKEETGYEGDVLFPSKPFLLGSSNNFTISDEASSTIMVKAGNSYNIHCCLSNMV